LEYIAGADWSVPIRRVVEFFASFVILLIILALPLIFNLKELFEWAKPEVIQNDEILQGKSGYLNNTFFIIRLIIYCGIWSLFYFALSKNSKKQDRTKEQILTKRNIILSAVFIPLFAITTTVFSIDW
jgi:magnesium-transporting ATPase (P-type)